MRIDHEFEMSETPEPEVPRRPVLSTDQLVRAAELSGAPGEARRQAARDEACRQVQRWAMQSI